MNTYSLNDIARYEEGDMLPEERQSFEQALASEATLQHQLSLYREVHTSLKQHFNKDEQQQQLENTLQSMRGEYFGKKSAPAKVVSMNRYLKYAMGVAAVLLVAVFLWKPWQPSLYEQYAQLEMINPAERGDNTDSLLQQAAIAFNKKEFGAATGLLEKAKQSKPGDSFTGFYYGVALMQTGKTEAARNELTVIYHGESVFKYEAAYYLALTYLKEENKTACREWLQKIPADAASYGKAQELLNKL